MTTITLPPDLESALVQSASRAGTTPESLAIDTLRQHFPTTTPGIEPVGGETLYDFIKDHIGTVSGSSEPVARNSSRLFAEGLAEAEEQRRARS